LLFYFPEMYRFLATIVAFPPDGHACDQSKLCWIFANAEHDRVAVAVRDDHP